MFKALYVLISLQAADWFFLIFHSFLILFNLFGWMVKRLRKAHLVTIGLTFLSWGLLGIWYGWGYCPLTDWHWQVLAALGESDLPNSYISYILNRLAGWYPDAKLVDAFTLGLAFIALGMSIWVNFFKVGRTGSRGD